MEIRIRNSWQFVKFVSKAFGYGGFTRVARFMGLASFPFGHFLLKGIGQVEDFAIAAHDAAPVAEIAGAAGEEFYHLAAEAGAAGGRRVADGVGYALRADFRQAVLQETGAIKGGEDSFGAELTEADVEF